MKAAVESGGVDAGSLDLYVFGNVLRAGHGQLIPRQAAFKAGFPDHVDGFAVDMVCSSGMMSVMSASSMIRAGDADIVLAGGVESMSGQCSLQNQARSQLRATCVIELQRVCECRFHSGRSR